MRWRFSAWDLLVVLLLLIDIIAARWLLTHVTGMVPTHWGPSGQPDHFAPISAVTLLIPALLGPLLYVGLRSLDVLVIGARRPEYYGFMTNVAGGMALMTGLLSLLTMWAVWRPGANLQVMPIIGLFFVYLGWLMRTAPDVPFNTAGLIPDTKEARNAVRQPLGLGLILTGAAASLLGLLPGAWAMTALLPMMVGPLLSIGVGLSRAPRN